MDFQDILLVVSTKPPPLLSQAEIKTNKALNPCKKIGKLFISYI